MAKAPSALDVQAEKATKILDAIKPHLKIWALRPISTDVYQEFLSIGESCLPDSSVPQMQALSDGFDKLMLAPGYLQLKDELNQFCQRLNPALKAKLDAKRGSI
jgi:hypothetical protein